MRKYIIGIFIGFCLSFAIGAHAEVMNMIGKTVESTVDLTINNQKMEYQAVLIDGTTYAPIRALSEATGYILRYDNETGVKLIKKITTPKETVLKSIEVLNGSIKRNENAIKTNELEIERLNKEQQTETVKADINTAQLSIDRWEKDIIEITAQISKLNQTILQIEEQEVELAK